MIKQNINIEKWLENALESDYYDHKKVNYFDFYKVFKEKANEIHSEVTASANFKEAEKGKLVFMNDHGPLHIETVINRASKLLDESKLKLNPKEVYYLLTSIHLHDIGNLYGRINHIEDMVKIYPVLESLIKLDAIESRYIRTIAEAHGGEFKDGNKDKIDVLAEEENTLEGTVRHQLLASILRLADELADDKYRANKIWLYNNLDSDSAIYHAYSFCLSNVTISHTYKQIELQFHIPEKFATYVFKKNDKKIFLLDEIYNRVLKMHHERHYTMRFTRGLIDLTSILTRIEFYPNAGEDEAFITDKITFELKEKGYPGESSKTIFQICDTLVKDGSNMNGAFMKRIILDAKKKAKKQKANNKLNDKSI